MKFETFCNRIADAFGTGVVYDRDGRHASTMTNTEKGKPSIMVGFVKYDEDKQNYHADFYENGRHWSGKYFVMDFPHSNGGFIQLNYGENMECLLESMKNIFEHIGGVPTEIWFDNTKTIVTEVIFGGNRILRSYAY